MPLEFRTFRHEIESAGFTLLRTKKGHYWVVAADGSKLVLFAVSHKRNSRGEVFDSYLSLVRKTIAAFNDRSIYTKEVGD